MRMSNNPKRRARLAIAEDEAKTAAASSAVARRAEHRARFCGISGIAKAAATATTSISIMNLTSILRHLSGGALLRMLRSAGRPMRNRDSALRQAAQEVERP